MDARKEHVRRAAPALLSPAGMCCQAGTPVRQQQRKQCYEQGHKLLPLHCWCVCCCVMHAAHLAAAEGAAARNALRVEA